MTKAVELLLNCMVIIAGYEAVKGLDLIPGIHYLDAGDLDELVNKFIKVVENLAQYFNTACRAEEFIRKYNSAEIILSVYKDLIVGGY